MEIQAGKYKDYLPPLSIEEYESLKLKIQNEGFTRPIFVNQDGIILDGHNRFKIATELNVECPYNTLQFSDKISEIAFVYSENLCRRNLSPDQRAELREKQKELAFELNQAGKTQEKISLVLSVAQNTISVWLSENATNINGDTSCKKPKDQRVKIPEDQHETIWKRNKKDGESQEQIAADYGVTHQAIGKIIDKVEKKKELEEKEIARKNVIEKTFKKTETLSKEEKSKIRDRAEYENLPIKDVEKIAEAVNAVSGPNRRKYLLNEYFSPLIHDATVQKKREKEFGETDPKMKTIVEALEEGEKEREWDKTPESKELLSLSRRWRKNFGTAFEKFDTAIRIGKFPPEGVLFLQRKLYEFADFVREYADTLLPIKESSDE